MAEMVHFKLAHDGKTHRFAPTVRESQLYDKVRQYVANVVKQESFLLFWRDGDSQMPLESAFDLSSAIGHAKSHRSGADKSPCVHLVVDATAADEAQDQSTCSLRAMLDAASEQERVEENNLLDLLNKVQRNPSERVVVHGFYLRKDYDWGDLKMFKKGNVDGETADPSEAKVSEDKLTISFYFATHQVFSLWKTCVSSAFVKLDIPTSSLSTFNIPPLASDESPQTGIEIAVNSDQRESLLELLKPLADITHFPSVSFDEINAQTADAFSTFFDGVSVEHVNFNRSINMNGAKLDIDAVLSGKADFNKDFKSRLPNETEVQNFNPWLTILLKMKPKKIDYYRCQLTQDLISFLVRASDVVDSISIGAPYEMTATENSLPLPIVKEILSRKCSYLHASDGATKVCRDQVEELCQFFQKLGKKISLAIPTDGNVREGRIADYRVDSSFFNKSTHKKDLLLIEHVEMDPKAEDDERIVLLRKGKETTQSNQPSSTHLSESRSIESQAEDDNRFEQLREMVTSARELPTHSDQQLLLLATELEQNNGKLLVVNSFHAGAMDEMIGGEMEMHFKFASEQNQKMWQTALTTAFSKLGIPTSSVSVSNSRIFKDRSLDIDLKKDDIKRLIPLLRPLIGKTHFEFISIEDRHPEILHMCAELLEGASVKSVNIAPLIIFPDENSEDMSDDDDDEDEFIPKDDVNSFMEQMKNLEQNEREDFTGWLNFVRRVKPSGVSYSRVELTQGLIDFLLNAAEVVDTIDMKGYIKDKEAVPLTLVRDLLSRKCTYVQIFDQMTKVSHAQIHELAQYFQTLGKKVSLVIATDDGPIDTQFGDYRVRNATKDTFSSLDNIIVIEHVEMNPKAEDNVSKAFPHLGL